MSRYDINIVINTDYLVQNRVNPISVSPQQVYVQQPSPPMAEAVYVDASFVKVGKKTSHNTEILPLSVV